MASTLGTHPYDYQKASTLATRALVSETKPAEIPSSSSHDFHLTNKDPDFNHPTGVVVGSGGVTTTTTSAAGAGPPATNNYHQASSSATAAAAAEGAPAQRRQSWNPSDLKREAHEKLLEAGSLKGYHSSGCGGGSG
ncbi:hypothetical protein KC343_g2925 [Hortaea werneckii]|uniref:Uncharacterized protein n=1 Tax=Hortaea werneckii TaxID=91943 RepID=A0A3M7HMD1_HORWE|nr:hypothetical protein KC352_g16061 [Hortaea werneckii]KAI7569407.1 hypothetical protein KC317_g3364 [Hortaea werneckii]KAI7623043.1 hypothetical protein KC346_g2917 [Hortaea werneckii]KAI7633463.1 hypothetical protein KC343_g2925 [Hortaea werneckii]KAI7652789.1 hypothetical protein KC319_g10656 [Hortaea werneckii]